MAEIRMSVSEFQKIDEWLKENNINPRQIVTIETSNAGGIGECVRAFVETKEDRGIWIDATYFEYF